MATRQKLFAGNWKMYKNSEEARAFLDKFFAAFAVGGDKTAEYAVLAQSALLPILAEHWRNKVKSQVQAAKVQFSWGAQNIYWEAEGAFTGELSPKLAKEMGSAYILAGHSERRQLFGETDESAAKRALAAHSHGMRAIFCVGENLAEREKGQIFAVLTRQCAALTKLAPVMPEGFVLAYEPVWAIGTGKTATAAQAEEVHAFLRGYFTKVWGEKSAQALRILYGGSVKPQNSRELLSCPNIDGVLVGGASLDPTSFFDIAVQAIQC